MTAGSIVEWRNEYNLGVDGLDNQHRSLVELINQVWECIVYQSDRTKALALVQQLELYTVAHFAAEEAYMRAVGYPNIEVHKQMHQQFIARIAAEKQVALTGGQLTLGLVEFLKQWLLNHIQVDDKAIAEYAKAARLARKKELQASPAENDEPESVLKGIFKRFF